MELTFGLLGISICAAWLDKTVLKSPSQHNNPHRGGTRAWRVFPLWAPLFCGACVSGWMNGYLHPGALIALGAFICCADLTKRCSAHRLVAPILGVASALFALALALHKIPGFANPLIFNALPYSADAPPLMLYANFDKGAAGLVLLYFFCLNTHAAMSLGKMLSWIMPVTILSCTAVMGCALALGMIRPELKFSSVSPVFLAVNLLFTVVAEEAFFRGMLQRYSHMLLQYCGISHRPSAVMAVGIAALFFGLAHWGGGTNYALLAMLAGMGYGWAYARTNRIEAAILVHFAVNAVHFIGFTYPRLITM